MSTTTKPPQKVSLKKFHVFKNPVPLRNSKDETTDQVINQLKAGAFAATYIEPYLIICDLGTKLTFVISPGDKPVIFRTCDDPLYIKGTPFKNCPLAVIGNDFQGPSKALKLKMYPYSDLTKENPSCVTINLQKKGAEITFDIYKISDNYSCVALGSSANGFIRILSSANFMQRGGIRETEIYLEGQLLKDLFPVITTDIRRQPLYYTTSNGVYYIDFIEKNKKGSIIFSEEVELAAINTKGEFITADNEFIRKINPRNPSKNSQTFVDRTKKAIAVFNNYVILVSAGKSLTTNLSTNFSVYDIENEYIAFTKMCAGVKAIVSGINSIFVIFNSNFRDKSELCKIEELENSEKLEKFFMRSFFDLAYQFANNNNYDKSLLAEISRYHGDHCFKKNDYENSIKQYIQTIGHVEPSYVIRKFLDVSQIEFLIKYLEELHNAKLANKHHTALLLNCFVKQKSLGKLKEWMHRVSMDKDKNMYYTETAVKVCMELDQIPLAKDLAKRCKHHELYLRILTENKVDASATQDQNEQFRSKECLTALNYIKNVEKKTDRSKFLRQFGNALVRYHPEKVLELLFDIIKEDYLDKKPQKEEEEKQKYHHRLRGRVQIPKPDQYFHLFVGSQVNRNVIDAFGEYLNFLLKHIQKLPNQQQILNATFEYNLEKCKDYFSSIYRQMRETLDTDIKQVKDRLLNMLKDQSLRNIIDKNHILLLFKLYRFTPGVTKICEMMNLKTELLNYYIEQDDIDEIYNFCCQHGTNEPNLWIIALNYICSNKENRLEERLDKIPDILYQVRSIENLSPMLILKILKGNKNIKAKHFKEYFIARLAANRDEIIENVELIKENEQETAEFKKKYKKVKTQAMTFQETICPICKTPLTNPTIHFMCGHSYNENCLEALECPLCALEQKEIIERKEQFLKQKITPKIYYSDLAKAKNKFEVVAEYLGKTNISLYKEEMIEAPQEEDEMMM